MVILRYKDIKKLSEKDKANKKKELNKELMRLKSQVASGSAPENPGRIRGIRRTLAKILTFENMKGGVNNNHE